jgi:hypothetical protein
MKRPLSGYAVRNDDADVDEMFQLFFSSSVRMSDGHKTGKLVFVEPVDQSHYCGSLSCP